MSRGAAIFFFELWRKNGHALEQRSAIVGSYRLFRITVLAQKPPEIENGRQLIPPDVTRERSGMVSKQCKEQGCVHP